MTALNLVLRLKGSAPALNKLGDGSFRPDVCAHTPGVASARADVLSRRFAPPRTFAVPDALAGAREVIPPTRNPEFWSARVATPA